MKRYILLFVVIVVSITSASAFELKPTSNSGPTTFRIWNVTQGPIPVTLNSLGSEDLSINDVESELQAAIGVWQKATGSIRLEYAGRNSNAVLKDSDQINSVLWEEKQWDYSSSTLAITKYTYIVGDPAYMIDSDILFNGKNFKWSKGQTLNEGTADFQQVLLHELGHLLGLSHTAVLKAAMYPYLPEKVKHILNKDDKRGLKFLYELPASDFEPVTPINGALYPNEILDMGLPLPVFRWYSGTNTTFILEFSDTSDFKKTISFSAGSNTYRDLSSSEINKVLALGQSGNIYWRISSGSTSTKIQRLKFRSIT